MTRSHVQLTLVALLLLAAVALKVDRYSQQWANSHAVPMERIAGVMAEAGWRADGHSNVEGGVYAQLQFSHPDCDTSVHIALLGGNAEGAEFFRRRNHGDAAFLQDGDVVARPAAMRLQYARLRDQIRALAGIATPPQLAVVAIAPAPAADVTDCRGPAGHLWRDALVRYR